MNKMSKFDNWYDSFMANKPVTFNRKELAEAAYEEGKRVALLEQRLPKRREVNYMIIEDEPDLLCIKDIGPWNIYKTITNAAEEVVEELAEQLGNRRLEYIDSDGQRDQLLVEDGKFAGFAPIYFKGKCTE